MINRKTGNIRHTEFPQGSTRKVCVMFSNTHTGLKAIRSSYLGRQNSWLPIKRCQTETSIKKGSASTSIKHIQFPLTLA